LFSEPGFSGYRLSLYYCGFADLIQYNFPTGGYWNDRTSSIVNYQSSGTLSDFYNWDGRHNFVWLACLWSYPETGGNTACGTSSPGAVQNLGADNDTIDGVHVC